MSPHRLLQEQVTRDLHYPWRVIVSCALLNRTTGQQAHRAAGELFQCWPDPTHWGFDFFSEFRREDGWADAQEEYLRRILTPLGFVNRRTDLLHDMTVDYLAGIHPADCRGVGQYARDALALFCENRLDVTPDDGHLIPYVEWRRSMPDYYVEWDEAGYVRWLAGERP